MKVKKLISCLGLGLFISSVSYSQGIPVVDSSALAKWAIQVAEMKKQYDQMEMQYQSMWGNRDMGQLLDDGVTLVVEEGFENNYLDLITQGEGGATEKAKEIYAAIGAGCHNRVTESGRANCEATAYAQPENAAFIMDSLEKGRDRVDGLSGLIEQIDRAEDSKAAADLANRIQAEQAILQNEQTMVNLALAQRQSQIELIAQKRKEENRRKLFENTDNPAKGMFR